LTENTKAEPLVSICCIAYNQEQYIGQALDGIFMQVTSFPLEVIIHDDASSDNTAGIIREYQQKYPDKIIPIFQKENRFSKGTRISATYVWPLAKGKYIALCEGDDYWTDPMKLQKQIDFLETHPDFTICFHQSLDLWEDGRTTLHNKFSTDSIFTIKDLTQSNFIATASCVIRNNLKEIPSWFYHVATGDWALFIYHAQFGNIYFMNECMSVYRKHSQGIWSGMSHDKMILEGVRAMIALDKYTNYKYHEDFLAGIFNRLKKGNPAEIQKLLDEDMDLSKELNIMITSPKNCMKKSLEPKDTVHEIVWERIRSGSIFFMKLIRNTFKI